MSTPISKRMTSPLFTGLPPDGLQIFGYSSAGALACSLVADGEDAAASGDEVFGLTSAGASMA